MPRLEDPHSSPMRDRIAALRARLPTRVDDLLTRGEDTWAALSPLQQLLLAIGGGLFALLTLLFAIFHSRIFAALVPLVTAWRDSTFGWAIIWLAIVGVSFPPLIGYVTCVTLAGFVFGWWRAFLITSTATVVGSTASFFACRHFLKGYVQRLVENDKRFEALALTLKHDGIKLLVMIRLCPLPYSLSNGAISAIPTITLQQWAIANAIATPKLLIACFIGSRLGQLASDEEMDGKTKLISWLGVIFGLCVGAGTGYFMYTKFQARARELEAMEGQSQPNGNAQRGSRRAEPEDLEAGFADDEDVDLYLDDPADRAIAANLARGADGISLHTTAPDDYADDDDNGYRDEWADDGDLGGDASVLDDVFSAGDGEDDDEPASPQKYRDERRGSDGSGW